MKREPSPQTPYKRKAKGKETRPGSCENQSSKTARARARTCTCTYEEAGDAAREIVWNCFGSEARDLGTWATYCRHYDRRLIVEKAYEYASLQRQGEIRCAITAFQSWLQRTFKKEV